MRNAQESPAICQEAKNTREETSLNLDDGSSCQIEFDVRYAHLGLFLMERTDLILRDIRAREPHVLGSWVEVMIGEELGGQSSHTLSHTTLSPSDQEVFRRLCQTH